MQISTPPRTYTITVDATERHLMRCALGQLAERHREAIRSAEQRAEQGVNVEPFLTGYRTELESVCRMFAALDDADQDVDTA